MMSLLVFNKLPFGEPEGNFLLGVLDAVRSVADITPDILETIISSQSVY